MPNLSVKYLGLELKNPLVVSSSGLTDSADKVRKIAECGAGAVVLKSLFEEQIVNQANCLSANEDYPEAYDYIQGYMQSQEVGHYLEIIHEAKRQCDIPVIASINCIGGGKWVEFAQQVQQAGADALEVNIFILPTDYSKPGSFYESQYYDAVSNIVAQVKLPVAIKVGRQFTNPLHVLYQLKNVGARGAVLFNRFYEPDINLESKRVEAADVFSTEKELSPTLRWLSMASAQIDSLDLAVSTGVHSGASAAKAILVGASAVEVCTVLYQHGPKYLAELLQDFSSVVEQMGFSSVEDMRGSLSYSREGSVGLFERSQFMRYFSNH